MSAPTLYKLDQSIKRPQPQTASVSGHSEVDFMQRNKNIYVPIIF